MSSEPSCVCGHPESAHADYGFLCNRFPCGCSMFHPPEHYPSDLRHPGPVGNQP